MSMLHRIDEYEKRVKREALSGLVSQFSGILAVNYKGPILSAPKYYIDDYAVEFNRVEATLRGPEISKRIEIAWALPGYLVESVRYPNINPGIQLPSLPFGAVSTKPSDVILITTIPKYWYPSVPDGDRLVSYDLSFDIPFLDLKNNRQYFKVAQNNVLDDGVLVIQLSNIPVPSTANGNISTTSSSFELGFT